MLKPTHSLGQDIRLLLNRRQIDSTYQALLNLLANKVTIDIYVLGALMKNRISGNLDGVFAVTMQRNREGHLNIKLPKQTNEPHKFNHRRS